MANDILFDFIKLYAEKFDDYPGWQLLRQYTEARNIEIIQECLEKGKDVYQLGYVVEPEDLDTFL